MKGSAESLSRRLDSVAVITRDAYVDWITIRNEVFLVEANSHFKTFGRNGYSSTAKNFVEEQEKDPAYVDAGISDITLGPGDKPKERPFRWITLA